MTLNMLTLQESDAAPRTVGTRLRQLSHPLTEIFMALLPKIDVNGSSKVTIALGPQGDEEAFDNVLGVTCVFIEDFDFKHFLAQDPATQNNQLLELLRQNLIAIATRKGENAQAVDAINATADAVAQAQFQLTLPIKKLSKSSKDRKTRFDIFRRLDSTVGEAWYCEVTRPGAEAAEKICMNDLPGLIDRRDFFKTAEVTDSGYSVKNRFGKVVFQAPLA